MVKVAIDAGHGLHTAGKRTPDGEREWTFNNKVTLATIAKLNTYQNVQILRLDDPTGMTDVPLKARTDRANQWNADVLVSIHHNALTGKWGVHGGIETFTMDKPNANPESVKIANLVHPRLLDAMGLRNRGIKKGNLHMLREFKKGEGKNERNMPAILTEGGFMDSLSDILVMRNDAKLKEQGEAIAEGLAVYFKLKPKTSKVEQVSNPVSNSKVYDLRYGDTGELVRALQTDLNKLGYKLTVDGSFGPAVENAVKAFQRTHKLTVDGIHGPGSQAKLAEVLKPKPVPKPAPKPIPTPIKGNVYRVIVDGKQTGAFGDPGNIASAVRQAVEKKAKKIEIEKI